MDADGLMGGLQPIGGEPMEKKRTRRGSDGGRWWWCSNVVIGEKGR